MTSAGVESAQVGENFEVLEQRLRHGREVVLAADTFEIGFELLVGEANGVAVALAEGSADSDVVQMPQELFAIEVGQCPSPLRIHWNESPPLLFCQLPHKGIRV